MKGSLRLSSMAWEAARSVAGRPASGRKGRAHCSLVSSFYAGLVQRCRNEDAQAWRRVPGHAGRNWMRGMQYSARFLMFYLIQANPEKNAAGACRTGPAPAFAPSGNGAKAGCRVLTARCDKSLSPGMGQAGRPGGRAGNEGARHRKMRPRNTRKGPDAIPEFHAGEDPRARRLGRRAGGRLAGCAIRRRPGAALRIYDAMRAEGQGSYTWFPVFLPASARQIVLYTRVDTNYFHAGFSLDAKAMADFDVHLKTGASAEGLRLLREQQRGIGRAWCAGAVPGRRVGHALPDRQDDASMAGISWSVWRAPRPARTPAMKQAAGRYCESEPGA